MKLTRYKLGEILELQRGYDLPSSQMKKGDILVAGSNGVIGYHNEARSNHPCITVGRSGSVGKVHYYEQATWAHNTALFVKDFKGNDPKYLYYFLKNLHLDKMFDKGSSVVPSLDRKVVHSLNVPCHKDIDCQKRIAAILSKIDRKIELNCAINQNLEAMAKQLYDYWFVQFDFPNEEGKPYKSSGEVMVYNERFGREIPQGWSTMPISEILDKYPTTKRYETKEYLSCGKYPIIDQGDSYIVGFTNEVDHLLTRHPAVLFGDHSTKVKFLDFDFARGADGTQILYSSNEAVSQYYLYLAVSALQISNPGYSRHFKYLKELPIIIPDLKIANTFKNIVKPLFEEWTKNIFCNIELTKQRNELLPLLMNGQVSVNSDLSLG